MKRIWWKVIGWIEDAWERFYSWVWYWAQRRTKMVNVATIDGRMRLREYYDNDDIEIDLGKRLRVGDGFVYDNDAWRIVEIKKCNIESDNPDDWETCCKLEPLSPHLIHDDECEEVNADDIHASGHE